MPVFLLQLLFDVAHHGFVQRRLLAAEVAVGDGLELVRQVGDDGLVGLDPAQDEGLHQALEDGGLHRVVVALHRQLEALAKARLGVEIAGIDEVEDGPEVGQPILHRRAGQREAVPGWQLEHGAGLVGLGVLDVLRLVEHHAVPVDAGEQLLVAPHQGIGGDDQVVLGGLGAKRLGVLLAFRAVMNPGAQARREAFDLFLPVADDRGGRDQ